MSSAPDRGHSLMKRRQAIMEALKVHEAGRSVGRFPPLFDLSLTGAVLWQSSDRPIWMYMVEQYNVI